MNQRRLIATCIALASTATVHAQPNVAVYGVLDTALRYSNNHNAARANSLALGEGVLTGSRLGFRGGEDLGGGVKAFFVLESGFSVDAGTSSQGGRLFGRYALLGIEGGFGKLQVGRQYTVAHEALSSFEAFGFSPNAIVGFQSNGYTGLRQDNMVKYSKSVGSVALSVGHTFGEVAGHPSAKSTSGASAVYSSGPLRVGGAYQVSNNVSTGYFNAVPEALASRQKVWGGGITYQSSGPKLFFGFLSSKLDVAEYQNRAAYVGFRQSLGGALELIGTVQHDNLKHPKSDGKRLTSALMLDYLLSKRTDVYVEVDHTKLDGGWIALASSPSLGTGSLAGNASRVGLMIGLRHRF